MTSLVATSAQAQGSGSFPQFDMGWLLFGDMYHAPSHHLADGDGATGLVVRRGYLTFDADFADDFFSRIRLELNQSGEFESYDFDVKFKDVFLGWKINRHELHLGLSPTLTFDLIESKWDFRYLARTPMDLQGVASRDTGVALRGPLNASGSLAYRAMVGSGINFGNESGDGQKWMGAITWRPGSRWLLDIYADYERLSGPTDRKTLQAFLAYEAENFSWGVQYSNQDREDDPPLELASAFFHKQLGSGSRIVLRTDRLLEPSPKGNGISYLPFDPTARATFLLAGVEFRLAPKVFLTPNVATTYYDRNHEGVRPETDVYLRLTLFLDFE